MNHPSAAELKQFLWEQLAEDRTKQITEHLESCEDCNSILEQENQVPLPVRAMGTTESWPAVPMALLGTAHPPAVPGYKICSVLGHGGMGVVYLAEQIKLGRLVALKMILSGGHAGTNYLTRFRTEGEALARLQHPNIVQIYEVGERDGQPFFSLEYCRGGNLDRKLNSTPLSAKDAATLVETLARAMHAAHENGIVHRDLKPANVLLAEDGTPKITDFGLAKMIDGTDHMTTTGRIMGTPSYMSPEQAAGKNREVGPLCDVYALGAILYACLTGRPPFKAATPIETLLQVNNDEPAPPGRLNRAVPSDLEIICLKCLRKEPPKRYDSAKALADDLRQFLSGEPISARRDSWFGLVIRVLGKSQLRQEFNGWDIPCFIMAGLIVLPTLLNFFFLQTDQPDRWTWLVGAISFPFWGVFWFWVVRESHRPQEWQVLMIIAGNFVAVACSNWIVAGWILPIPLPNLFPHWTVINGLCFLFVATFISRWFYLFALGFFALGVAMSFKLEWAPVEYALAWAVTLIPIGLNLRRRRLGALKVAAHKEAKGTQLL